MTNKFADDLGNAIEEIQVAAWAAAYGKGDVNVAQERAQEAFERAIDKILNAIGKVRERRQ